MATILFNKIYPKGSLVKNITVGSTEVKFIKRGDGILFYDILKSNVYNPPTVTLDYSPNTSPAKGGTLSPSLSYSQSWYRIGYSGKTYSQTNIKSGASSITYSISGAGASINPSTGVVTWASRGTTPGEKREATVTVTVTINGEENTKTAKVYLEANAITSSVVTINSFSYGKHGIYPTGTYASAVTPSISCSATNTYTSGETKTPSLLYEYTKVAGASDASVDDDTGAVSFSNSGGNTDDQTARSCTVRVTVTTSPGGETATKDAICYQLVDSQTSNWKYKSHSASYPGLVPATGTDELRSKGLYLVVTHSYVTRWSFGGAEISSTDTTKTYSTSSSDITLSNLSISGAGASINTTTGKVTWEINGDALRLAEISGKFKMNSITTSFSATSTLDAGYTYKIRVKFINNVNTAVIVPFSCYSTNRDLVYTRISGSASLSASEPSLLIPPGTHEGYITMYTRSTISGTNLSIVFLRPYKNGTNQSDSTLKIGSSSSATTITYTRTFQKMSSSTAVPSTTNTIYIRT